MSCPYGRPHVEGQDGIKHANDQEGAAPRFGNLREMYHLWPGGFLCHRTTRLQGENFSTGGSCYPGTRHLALPLVPLRAAPVVVILSPAPAGRRIPLTFFRHHDAEQERFFASLRMTECLRRRRRGMQTRAQVAVHLLHVGRPLARPRQCLQRLAQPRRLRDA
jgi:hypothetical protein